MISFVENMENLSPIFVEKHRVSLLIICMYKTCKHLLWISMLLDMRVGSENLSTQGVDKFVKKCAEMSNLFK